MGEELAQAVVAPVIVEVKTAIEAREEAARLAARRGR